jgi:methyl-accepting chemotaxis protein
MIQALQNGTQQAVSVMAAGREEVDDRVQQTTKALKSLSEITKTAETVNEMNIQIATTTKEQCSVVEEINHSISNINKNSKQTSQRVIDTSNTAHELRTLASELQRVVQQFSFSGDIGFDLSSAKSAHLAWKAEEAVSHHDCTLGKWYYGEALSRYCEIAEIDAIEVPHQQLYQLIKKIISHVERGETTTVESLHNEIEPLSAEIIGQLNRVEQQINNR